MAKIFPGKGARKERTESAENQLYRIVTGNIRDVRRAQGLEAEGCHWSSSSLAYHDLLEVALKRHEHTESSELF